MSNKANRALLEALRDPEACHDIIDTLTMDTLVSTDEFKRLNDEPEIRAFLDRLAEIEIEYDPDSEDIQNEAQRIIKAVFAAVKAAECNAFKRGFDLAMMVNGEPKVFDGMHKVQSEILEQNYGFRAPEDEC